MASQASVASSQPDPRHLRLIAASAQANTGRVTEILSDDPAWTSHADRDALRQSLQKVATRGNLTLVRLLLQYGADPNTRRESETPALFKAAEGGHVAIVRELLAHKADLNWRNRNGQTALFMACMRGRDAVVKALLDAGASADVRDKEGRTALLFLASEKSKKLKTDTLRMLLEKDADIEARDTIGRTPLLWAATNGNVPLVAALLSGELSKKADISAANNRGRNALHLAAESNHEEMVKLLLSHGADPQAVSDGGWTALHNAAQSGHAGTVALLLAAEANVNAELSNGMTPLHWAAFNGHDEIVKLILARPETDITIKDGFDRTAMLCAAERHHKDIVQLLSPARAADRLSTNAQRACKEFEATVVDFGNFRDGKKQLVFKHSVHELLYGWDEDNNKPKIPTLTKNIKYQPAFRWIHLPANNIAWIETLLAKNFVESGHKDIEAFKALEKSFDQEHRGHYAHAHFMRTFCQRIAAPQNQEKEKEEKTLVPVTEEMSDVSTISSGVTATSSTPKKLPEPVDVSTPKSDAKKKSKSEQIAVRHPKRAKRANGPPGNPPGTKENKIISRTSSQLSWEASKLTSANGKMVLFMPFLHYETDERRQRMSNAIRDARARRPLPDRATRDDLLIHAYVNNLPPLHPRRTLDQFFYHGIDTSARDTDQVVYRYCKRYNQEPKVFMVDQLWLYLLGKDLVITCFPQRWDQPKHDPLNVLDGIIEETNAKTRPPIQSVYDLAMLITNRCSGMFDRHRLDDQDYQFLDMFESSIGRVTNRESQLFSRFNKASRLSGQWLEHHRQLNMGVQTRMIAKSPSAYRKDPYFPDVLLDIGIETSLLAEIKDIRDELNIIAVILASQTTILDEFETQMTEELRSESTSRRAADSIVHEIRKRCREQRRLLDVHRKDIDRMDRQAESIYMSLTHLLDLKQKHSNALEARFARDQAVIAAKQGQTIMVFTIVTIIFLPMSFIAAFFAINVEEWSGDGARLTLPYVTKYLFGIGLGISIPLIAMAFTVTDIFDALGNASAALGAWLASGRIRREQKKRRREEDDESSEEDDAPKREQQQHMRSRTRPSFADETRTRPGVDVLSAREGAGAGYERGEELESPRSAVSRLSVRLSGGGRKLSAGSASVNGFSWARPSFDRVRGRVSEDLERGKESSGRAGASRDY